MEEEYESFDLTQQMTAHMFTKEMHELAFEKYVFAPGNKKLNREAANEYKKSIEEFFTRNRDFNIHNSVPPVVPPITPIARCPRCNSTSISTQKKGFGVGKAAAGVLTVGTAGALAGAAGANKVYNICQKCGHKWTPGR